jgi:hypothetical protein
MRGENNNYWLQSPESLCLILMECGIRVVNNY